MDVADKNVDALALLRGADALLEGHFLLSSGLHSGSYVQCAQLLQYPDRAEAVGRALAARAPVCDVVVSPAMGGLFLGHEVARALGKRHVFTERENGAMVLRRGFALGPRARCLVVEDVFTTGKSTREVFDVLRAAGAVVAGAVSLVFRGAGDLGFGVPTESLVRLALDTWEPAACPLCKQGLPLVKPGSRKQPTGA
ncbi:MAG: orotate phosphoribosyltransferase [Deltaproteobacteria bacterium]|nr:orotate phosphoribosyltransferase [Deltaproteobacteria bacterium]